MDIVYNCDEKFVPYGAVSIASLLENNREEREICIHMLSNGISEASRRKLCSMVKAYEIKEATGEKEPCRREIRFIDISDIGSRLEEVLGKDMELGRFGATALGRLFAPELIREADRLLYIDSDTVINGSLRELYELELRGDELCAMALEPTIYKEVKEQAGLKAEEPYFNSGVILMDARAWRKLDVPGLISSFMSDRGKLKFPDQDILNGVFGRRALVLPQRFNFFSGYYYQSYKELVRLFPGFAESGSKEDFEKAKRAPVILHFAGDERPWIAGNLNPYRKLYRGYRELTPWRDVPDMEGKRGYMLFYHAVNMATAAFPPFRRIISGIYYKLSLAQR